MTHLSWPLLLGFLGTSPLDPEVQTLRLALEEKKAAGVILFAHNIESKDQVQELVTFIKQDIHPTPLVAIDQEGGKVARLNEKNHFPPMLSAKDVAQQMSPDEAYKYYLGWAKTLHGVGINLNLGPVVDVHDDQSPIIAKYGRAFSGDPLDIVAYAQAFVRAHREYHITTCLKHYPGHGTAHGDTHAGFVDITTSYDNREKEPFDALIKAGYADTMMMSHLYHKEWDDTHPLSLSKPFIQSHLRGRSGFKGPIISDDYDMKAISNHYLLEEIVSKALDAGVNILIFSQHMTTKTPSDWHQNLFNVCAALDIGQDTLEPCHLLRQKMDS